MLASWKKAMANLDSVLKSRDITLSKKVRLVKAMVFPVVRYGCESRTVKCWEPAQEIPPMAKVMRKRPEGQGKSGLEGSHGPARASTPKPESVLLFYAFH